MFQRTDVDYGISLAEEISLVLDFLDCYSTNPGPGKHYLLLSSAVHALTVAFDIPLNVTPGCDVYWLDRQRKRLCASLRDEIRSYFPHNSLNILSTIYKLLNVHRLPDSVPPVSFFAQELAILCLHYGQGKLEDFNFEIFEV